MLFVRKTTPTVVVEDNAAARVEAARLAEDRAKASGTVAVLGFLAVAALLFLVGYFAWWAPVNAANANQTTTPVVQHDTQVIERPTPSSGPTTIVNNPPVQPPVVNPPTVIHQDHIVPVPQEKIVPVPVPTPVPSTGNNNGQDNSGNGTTAGDDRG